MADSTLTRTGESPPKVSGRDNRTLGPSDTSDGGSDLVGSGLPDDSLANDSDAGGTGELASADRTEAGRQSRDIDTDHVIDADDTDSKP